MKCAKRLSVFIFQHQFRISYRIILREKELHLNIGVYNPSKVTTRYLGWFSMEKGKIWSYSQETPFDFNVLLHSYFKCPDVRRCQVGNLQMRTFPQVFKTLTKSNSGDWVERGELLGPDADPAWGTSPGSPTSGIFSFSVFERLQISAQNKRSSKFKQKHNHKPCFFSSAACIPRVQRSSHTIRMDGQVSFFFENLQHL